MKNCGRKDFNIPEITRLLINGPAGV